MDDIISKVDDKKTNSSNIEVPTENTKIKYYECNEQTCTFEISENAKQLKDEESVNTEGNVFGNGEITVTSILDYGEHEYLQGVKINLYKINGLSPILIKSKITDEEGKVVFSNIEDGCYRVIELIDKQYFEKPKYINWNEIIIDSVNKSQKVIVVNRIKKSVSQNKHKH